MTTAKILKCLETAKSEAEMLAMAEELGVTRAFFNVGGVTDLAGKPLPKIGASKKPAKRKPPFTHFLTKSKQPKKMARRPSVGA
jgi:hypothetical protein